jgi:hypothetical protein
MEQIIQAPTTGLLGMLLPVQFAFADADGERAALSRIMYKIQSIRRC